MRAVPTATVLLERSLHITTVAAITKNMSILDIKGMGEHLPRSGERVCCFSKESHYGDIVPGVKTWILAEFGIRREQTEKLKKSLGYFDSSRQAVS